MLQPFSKASLKNLTGFQDKYINEGDGGIGVGTMAWFINLVTNTSATAVSRLFLGKKFLNHRNLKIALVCRAL